MLTEICLVEMLDVELNMSFAICVEHMAIGWRILHPAIFELHVVTWYVLFAVIL